MRSLAAVEKGRKKSMQGIGTTNWKKNTVGGRGKDSAWVGLKVRGYER